MLRLSREIANEDDTQKEVKKRHSDTETDRGIYRRGKPEGKKPKARQENIKTVNENRSRLVRKT